MEIASLVASVVSIALGVFAVWLAVVFYKMSTQSSEATREAAKGIAASVDRLEKVFDKLYADTFSMMRDTVSDMRKHIWPEGTPPEATAKAEEKAEEKIQVLKTQMEDELAKVVGRVGQIDERVRRDINKLMDRVVSESRRVDMELRETALREAVLATIRRLGGDETPVPAERLVARLASQFPGPAIIREIEALKRDGVLLFTDKDIGPNTPLTLVRQRRVSRSPP